MSRQSVGRSIGRSHAASAARRRAPQSIATCAHGNREGSTAGRGTSTSSSTPGSAYSTISTADGSTTTTAPSPSSTLKRTLTPWWLSWTTTPLVGGPAGCHTRVRRPGRHHGGEAAPAVRRRLRELMRHRRGGEVARVASMAWRAGSESLGTAALVSAQTWTRGPNESPGITTRTQGDHELTFDFLTGRALGKRGICRVGESAGEPPGHFTILPAVRAK